MSAAKEHAHNPYRTLWWIATMISAMMPKMTPIRIPNKNVGENSRFTNPLGPSCAHHFHDVHEHGTTQNK